MDTILDGKFWTEHLPLWNVHFDLKGGGQKNDLLFKVIVMNSFNPFTWGFRYFIHLIEIFHNFSFLISLNFEVPIVKFLNPPCKT